MNKTIGERIKLYRNAKKLSQKELGIKCGFSYSTADVRIGQYENNSKIPRNDILLKIAKSLSIEPIYLQLGYLSNYSSEEIIKFINKEAELIKIMANDEIKKLEKEKAEIDVKLNELYKQTNLKTLN